MISSHHKVRFEFVVPTNDWILVVSLLHHFVLTLPSLTSGDVIMWSDGSGKQKRPQPLPPTTGSPMIITVSECWMSSSSRWRNTMHHPLIVTQLTCPPVPWTVSWCLLSQSWRGWRRCCQGVYRQEKGIWKYTSGVRSIVRSKSTTSENEKADEIYLRLVKRSSYSKLCLNRMSKFF